MTISGAPDQVVDVTGLATAVLAGLTLVSVIVAVLVGRDAARSAHAARQAQAFLQLYPWYRSKRAHLARHIVRGGDFANLSDSEHQIVQELYGYYELVAIYIDAGIVDEDIARKIFSAAFRQATARIDDWLAHHKPGNADLYAIHLRTMVRRWPISTTDAMPSGVLTRPYKIARGEGVLKHLQRIAGHRAKPT